MFTKNWYYFCAANRIGIGISSYWTSLTGWGGDKIKKYKDYTSYSADTNRNLYNFMSYHTKVSQSDIPTDKYSNGSNTQFSKIGVCFGSGTTPAAEGDYCMEGDLFTTYNYSQTYAVTKDSISYTYTITNTGTEDFTIGEVGLIAWAYSMYQPSSYSYYYHSDCLLLERTTLESPITIPANGGVGQITYTLKMDGLE